MIADPVFLLLEPPRKYNPLIPVGIENPLEPKEPYFVLRLVETPDLLRFSPNPPPRFALL